MTTMKIIQKSAIKLKFFIIKNLAFLFISIALALLAIIWNVFDYKDDKTIYLSFIAGSVSLYYIIQKQKMEEAKLFRELFKDFNERYYEINDSLKLLYEKENELSEEDKSLLVKYFNLCAEEYLYFDMGFIDPCIWKTWEQGMSYFLKNNYIAKFWASEKSSNSYYNLTIKIPKD